MRNEVIAQDDVSAALWDEIIVPTSVKERLLHHSLLALTIRPQLPFEVTALHGLITLYGPPGTGKTSLAKALPARMAAVLGGATVRLIEINPHGLMSGEHGASQQNVHDLLAEHIPSLAAGDTTVVVLDEVESMAVARSAASLSANPADVHRATDAVLTALDDNARAHPNLLFVATSNFTASLDDAFLSRSDVAIQVPKPSAEALTRILASTLDQLATVYPLLKDLAASNELANVAEAAVGMDGRRARKLVYEALARRLETTIDPGKLAISDLMIAVNEAETEPFDEEIDDAAA